MSNEVKKEGEILKVSEKNKRFAPYIVAGLIFGAAQTFVRNYYWGETILIVLAIGAGFLWYPLKSKIKIKNEVVKIIITFLILEIVAGLLLGFLAGLTNIKTSQSNSVQVSDTLKIEICKTEAKDYADKVAKASYLEAYQIASKYGGTYTEPEHPVNYNSNYNSEYIKCLKN